MESTFPTVEVRYTDLSFTLEQPKEPEALPSIITELRGTARSIVRLVTQRKQDTTTLRILDGMSGVLVPGTATLIVSSPGAGTTTLLRILSGRLAPSEEGQVLFNGEAASSLAAHSVNIKKLATLAPERDNHEPLLTVLETFKFAYDAAVPPALRTASTRGGAEEVAVAADAISSAGESPGASPATAAEGGMQPKPSAPVTFASLPTAAAAVEAAAVPPIGVSAADCSQHSSDRAIITTPAGRASARPAGSDSSPGTAPLVVPLASTAASAPAAVELQPQHMDETGHDMEWWNRVRTPEEMVQILGLQECANTIVGSNMIRGVSGGQRKRVTIGEALLANARILALDSITSGLDAATAYDVVKYINTWARRTGSIVIAALQQATPEIGGLFDDVILMSNGMEIYHGPFASLDSYLSSLGYVRPRYMDILDFASELVSSPLRAAELSMEDRRTAVAVDDDEDTSALNAASTTAPDTAGAVHDQLGVIRPGGFDSLVQPPLAVQDVDGDRRRALLQHAAETAETAPIAPQLTTTAQLCAFWRASPSATSMMGFSLAQHHLEKLRLEERRAAAAGTKSSLQQRPELQLTATLGAAADTRAPAADSRDVLAGVQSLPQHSALDVNVSRRGRAPKAGGVALESPAAKLAYGNANAVPLWKQAALTLNRQRKLVYRNKGLMIAKLLNSLVMSLILGTLFLEPPRTSFQLKYGLALFSVLFISFTNNAEIPASIQSRSIVYRQTTAGMYNEVAYVISNVLALLPINMLADFLYGTILYWMTGWVDDVDRWLVFLLAVFSTDMCMAAFFRCMAYGFRTQEIAQAASTGFIAIFILFAGFFVITSQMPSWLGWLIYVSPFKWAVTTIIDNEFLSSPYNVPASSVEPGAPSDITLGRLYANQFNFPLSDIAKWSGIIFLLGVGLLLNFALAPLILHYVRFESVPGTQRRKEETDLPPVTVGELAAAWQGMYIQGWSFGNGIPTRETSIEAAPTVEGAAGVTGPLGETAAPITDRSDADVEKSGYTGPAESTTGSAARADRLTTTMGGRAAAARTISPFDEEEEAPLTHAQHVVTRALPFIVSAPVPAPSHAPGGASGHTATRNLSSVAVNIGDSAKAGPAAADVAQQQPPPTASEANASLGGGRSGSVGRSAPTPFVVLPFPRVTLAFSDVTYTIRTPKVAAGDTGYRHLLRGVSGWCRPGTLTALMGASGAGKTTLIDVLSFRKTGGIVGGTFRLNGKDADAALVARVSGYCEQDDIHLPTATVEEALLFSSHLRLGGNVSEAQRRTHIGRLLHILELDVVRHRTVGSLSHGEQKRLTVGVELASSPSIVFLDEPTSGLDSRSAAVVMRVLRRVASVGRTVVATIHQPSAETFFQFDQLLLLAPGGFQVYFGRLGYHAASLTAYLERIPGTTPLPQAKNPASWMLEVLGVGVSDAHTNEGAATAAAPPAAGVAASVGTSADDGATHADSGGAAGDTGASNGSGEGGAQATPPEFTDRHGSGHSAPDNDTTNGGQRAPLVPPSGGGKFASADESIKAEALLRPPPLRPNQLVKLPRDFAAWYAESRLAQRNHNHLQRFLGNPAGTSLQHQGSGTEAWPTAPPTADGAPCLAPAVPSVLGTVLPVSRSTSSPPPKAALQRTTTGLATSDASPATSTPSANEEENMQPLTFATSREVRWQLQWWYVFERANVDLWRNGDTQIVRLYVLIYLGVLFGLIEVNVTFDSFAGTQSGLGFVLGGVAFAAVIFFSTGVTLHYLNREVFYRERAAGFYPPEAYSVSIFIAELPYVLFFVMINVGISYWIVGLNTQAQAFFFYYLGAVILSTFWMATGQAYSSLFSILPIAQIVGGLTISTSFLFAGLFINVKTMPPGWKGLYYAVPTSHIMRALGTTEFYCAGGAAAGCPQITVVTSSGPVVVDRYEFVSNFLGSTFQNRWNELGWAALAIAVMLAISILALRFVNHQTR